MASKEITLPNLGTHIGGDERIVVVDDEDLPRLLAAGMLKKLGYQVEALKDGEEVLRFVEQSRDKIDLLLSDVEMPGMNGVQLKEAIEDIDPSLKVVFMSGGNDIGVENYLKKPVTLDPLAKYVRAALDTK